MKIYKFKYFASVLVLSIAGCEGYLDHKPDQSLVVPSSLADIRSLLDNTNVFNKQPVLGTLAGDEFRISDGGFTTLRDPEQGAYLWQDDPFQGESVDDWFIPYQQVFYSNVAFEALNMLNLVNDQEFRTLKGETLFQRAHAYFHLLQQFAPPYKMGGRNTDFLGIVLKDIPDVNEPVSRSNLEESYKKVIGDLEEAVELLPDFQLPKTRPTKAAALGMLARVYLLTFDFGNAALAAEEALSIYSDRKDFNDVDLNVNFPFVRFGEETVFYSELISVRFTVSREVLVNSDITESYQQGDLRLKAFFDEMEPEKLYFIGKLTGNFASFGGLSVGELELIAAEGNARIGNEEKALQILNGLLARRFNPEFFQPVEETGHSLVKIILDERKKELVGRGLRWSDLRRLNQEQEFSTTIEKEINGQKHLLNPNSIRYVFPIPDQEIRLTGIQQNPR